MCRDRGLDPATDHGQVATALREENGPAAIAERSLPMIDDHLEETDTVLVDGLRSDVEMDAFRDRFGEEFVLLSIEAPFEVRKERITDRGRDDTDDGESLRERDERELGFGMGEAIEQADVTIENTASLERFREQIRTVLEDGVAALEGKS